MSAVYLVRKDIARYLLELKNTDVGNNKWVYLISGKDVEVKFHLYEDYNKEIVVYLQQCHV